MNNKFMPSMVMLTATISPGRSTDYNIGIGGEGTETDQVYCNEDGLFFIYIVDGSQGAGWYEIEDRQIFYANVQDGWVLID